MAPVLRILTLAEDTARRYRVPRQRLLQLRLQRLHHALGDVHRRPGRARPQRHGPVHSELVRSGQSLVIGPLIPVGGFRQAAKNDKLAACAPLSHAALDGGGRRLSREIRGVGV